MKILYDIIPDLRVLDTMDYGDNEYNFTNASFPWETYKGSFNNLSNPGFKIGKAILLEDMYLDDTFFSPSLGKIIDIYNNV